MGQQLGVVLAAEAAAFHAGQYPSRKADYSPYVAKQLDIGRALDAPRYARALRILQEARHGKADAALGAADVLLLPTVSQPAPTAAQARLADPTAELSRLAAPFSFTGQPALSLPAGVSSEGLPLAVSLVGRRFADPLVLRVAMALEQTQAARWPAID